MITITDRESLRLSPGGTARFEGSDHRAGISFFWVDSEPGSGPDRHVHPYSETWVVLDGTAAIEADGRELFAGTGSVVTATAGTVHRFRSVGSRRLEMICIHASASIIQTFIQSTDDDEVTEPAPAAWCELAGRR